MERLYGWPKKRKLLRNLAIGRDLSHTQTANDKRAAAHRKPVVAIKNGQVKAYFKCSNEAESKTGIIARNIRHVANGKRKKAGGFEWKFEKDLI